jgi:hypothetical protein
VNLLNSSLLALTVAPPMGESLNQVHIPILDNLLCWLNNCKHINCLKCPTFKGFIFLFIFLSR